MESVKHILTSFPTTYGKVQFVTNGEGQLFYQIAEEVVDTNWKPTGLQATNEEELITCILDHLKKLKDEKGK